MPSAPGRSLLQGDGAEEGEGRHIIGGGGERWWGGCIVVHLQNKQGYILSRAPSNFLLIVVNARSAIQNSTREKQMNERKIQTKASLGLSNFGSNQAITFNKHQSTVMVKSFDGLHTALCWLVCICQSPSAAVFPFFSFSFFFWHTFTLNDLFVKIRVAGNDSCSLNRYERNQFKVINLFLLSPKIIRPDTMMPKTRGRLYVSCKTLERLCLHFKHIMQERGQKKNKYTHEEEERDSSGAIPFPFGESPGEKCCNGNVVCKDYRGYKVLKVSYCSQVGRINSS